MRRFLITGGPEAHTIRVVDSETGQDISPLVKAVHISASADPGGPVTATLTVYAAVSVMAEVEGA